MARSWGSSFGVAVIGIITGMPAQAGQFCDDVAGAIVAVRTGTASADALQIMLPGDRDNAASCSFSKDLSGARSANCNWAFPFRAPAANDAFDMMLEELTGCADPDFAIVTDQRVNHPDSFDLRLLRLADGEVSISIKDKAELRRSYVFLRATPLE